MMKVNSILEIMRKNTLLLVSIGFFLLMGLACTKEEPGPIVDYQRVTIKQEFSNDWSRWTYNGGEISGSIRTEFSNSWNRWLYNGQSQNGQIRTEFSESWDRWNYYSSEGLISIRTEFSESWNRWEIEGPALDETIFIRTQISNDNTRWVISTPSSINIAELKTEFSNDYRRWELRYNPEQVQLEELEIIPMLFIAVFTASVYEQQVF